MARFPYTSNLTTGREYYGPSTGLTQDQNSNTLYTNNPQRPPVSAYDQFAGFGKFAAGVGTLALLGNVQVGKKRVWDYYHAGFQTFEEYTPGYIGRTFQLSNIFSPLTTEARNTTRFYSPDVLAQHPGMKTYLASLIGEDGGKTYVELGRQGVRLEKGRLVWAQTGEVALKYASFIPGRGESVPARFGASYARSLGASERYGQFESLFLQSDLGQVVGGQTRFQAARRYTGGIATELVTRFNRLLEAPFEMEPFKTVFEGAQNKLKRSPLGINLKFGVAKGPAGKMVGRLAMKYGLGLGAIALGYSTADWMVKKSELLDNTILDEGITMGAATLWTRGNVVASQIAEYTGLHAYREKQEEIAPGSTDLQKLMAFPLMGAFFPSIGLYGYRVGKQAARQLVEKESADVASRVVKESFKDWGTFGSIGKSFESRFVRASGYYSRPGFMGSVVRGLAKPGGEKGLYYKFLGRLSPTKALAIGGFAAGLALAAPFLPGALIPSTRPDELKDIYSGKQEIAVRKGRWWEFGRSPHEGSRISYFRPHWYPTMLADAREKAIWGDDYERLSPFEKWWKQEFTYELEQKHYRDRPYPVTALPFEDIPLVGPLLAGTIGRLIKPPRLMHTEEWMSDEGTKVGAPGFGQRRATEIGEELPGSPISPYGPSQIAGEQIYRMTEMVGLPGFLFGAFKKEITGTEEFADQLERLQSPRRMFGFERKYWDWEVGGLAGTTEAFRRLYPHRRRQIDEYNPIRNLMPDWLPGEGDRSPNFQVGDPYLAVTMGEIRLPGPGYEERYPELKGVSPEDYPLIHQYRILADVAQYSDKFDEVTRRLRSKRSRKSTWSDYEERMYQQVQEQLAQKRQRIEFEEYEYLNSMGGFGQTGSEESSALISKLNRIKASQQEKPGLLTKLYGGYWEALAHNATTPLDSLTPISPGSKLVHHGTAIEKYERNILYGTENSFWQHPIRDFLAPFTRSTARAFGYTGVFGQEQKERDIKEYFDILKYVKNARLANIARWAGDSEAVREFESQKDETLFGINPFTRNYTSVFRSLPSEERNYFTAFAEADTEEERKRILEMVPQNEKALYIARWKLQFAEEIKKAQKADQLSDDELKEADTALQKIYDEAKSEGFPSSKELFAEYLQTKYPGENYADWYRRVKILPNVQSMPGSDWIGWHPSVDLEDIKLKLIDTIGEDMHDYNLWPSRLKAMQYKPYINEESIAPFLEPERLTKVEMSSRINKLLNGNVQGTSFISKTNDGRNENVVEINIKRDISGDIETALSNGF